MEKNKKSKDEDHLKRDTGMLELLLEQVSIAEQGVIRARQYLRLEEIRKERYQLKLDHYKKTGELLSEEQLREKIPN